MKKHILLLIIFGALGVASFLSFIVVYFFRTKITEIIGQIVLLSFFACTIVLLCSLYKPFISIVLGAVSILIGQKIESEILLFLGYGLLLLFYPWTIYLVVKTFRAKMFNRNEALGIEGKKHLPMEDGNNEVLPKRIKIKRFLIPIKAIARKKDVNKNAAIKRDRVKYLKVNDEIAMPLRKSRIIHILLKGGLFFFVGTSVLSVLMLIMNVKDKTPIQLLEVSIFGMIICFCAIKQEKRKNKILFDNRNCSNTESGLKNNSVSKGQFIENETTITDEEFFSEMSPYDFEEYVAALLRDKGYTNVRTTPKSGDFGADVLAVNPEGVRMCIQCKLYSKPVGVDAVKEVYAAKSYYECDVACVYSTNSYTQSAKKMAEKLHVKLYTINKWV